MAELKEKPDGLYRTRTEIKCSQKDIEAFTKSPIYKSLMHELQEYNTNKPDDMPNIFVALQFSDNDNALLHFYVG